MRALVRCAKEGAGVAFAEVTPPVPADDELVVAVSAFSINRGELALLRVRPDGWRPGQDFAGTVIEEARSGRGPGLGARIFGLAPNASWAEQVAVATDAVATIPQGLSDSCAAALPLAGTTAVRTLRRCGPLLGKRVLLTAGSGGVGQLHAQLLALAGARGTAIVRDPAMRAKMAAAVPGVQFVAGLDDLETRFDIVLDALGGAVLARALKRLAPDGIVLSFGNGTGEGTPFSIFDFVGAENATIMTYFSYHEATPLVADLEWLAELATGSALRLICARARPWSEINTAIGDFSLTQASVKQVLTL